jgi:hypothetical protein
MSLSLVFRLQAALFTFFGAMMLLAPGALMATFNVEGSGTAEDIMRGLSLMALGMAYISWQMPSWASENIKSVGMFFAILHALWVLLTLFQISTGAFPAGAANIIGNIAPDVVLAALFFWKSR